MSDTKMFKAGDKVKSAKFGEGVVLSREHVELASDDEHTFYVVEMADGRKRNLKGSDLK